jgi:hypothetical protein
MVTAEQWLSLVEDILSASHQWQPDQLATRVDRAARRLGIRTSVYLIDHEQRFLQPLPQPDRPASEPLPVDNSLGGRAFTLVESVADASAGTWWMPMVNGTDRLGVVAFELPAGLAVDEAELQWHCENVAGMVGHLITTTTPRGDHLDRVRRSRPMTIGAELLWRVLPPLTVSIADLVVSAVLEPCYDVGGDGFDYALDARRPQFVVLDAAGRGLRAGLACAVVLASVRATRTAGGGLVDQARAADVALQEQFPDARFATAVLAELDLDTGVLRYLNAGHPAPVVVRGGKAVDTLTEGRRLPLGIDDQRATLGEVTLEPGDRLLLYTDGVTEARDTTGELFGEQRLVDFTERHAAAGLPVPETLRRLSHAVLEHQGGPPSDDATLVLVEWSPGAATRTVPPTSRDRN